MEISGSFKYRLKSTLNFVAYGHNARMLQNLTVLV